MQAVAAGQGLKDLRPQLTRALLAAGLFAIGVAAVVIVVPAAVGIPPAWDDTFCVRKNLGTEEGTYIEQDAQLLPPKVRCSYRSPDGKVATRTFDAADGSRLIYVATGSALVLGGVALLAWVRAG